MFVESQVGCGLQLAGGDVIAAWFVPRVAKASAHEPGVGG